VRYNTNDLSIEIDKKVINNQQKLLNYSIIRGDESLLSSLSIWNSINKLKLNNIELILIIVIS
jgi:hypothetical protein